MSFQLKVQIGLRQYLPVLLFHHVYPYSNRGLLTPSQAQDPRRQFRNRSGKRVQFEELNSFHTMYRLRKISTL